MHSIQFQIAEPSQLSAVKRFYKSSKYSPKTDRGDTTIIGLQDGQIVTVVRLQPKSSGYFLRAMVVDPALRGQGVGTGLLSWVINYLGDRYCYCFALEHLQSFYGAKGFSLADITDVNTDIASHFIRLTEAGRNVVIMHINCQDN